MQIFPLKLLKLPKLFPLKICACAFFVVPLHREPAPGNVCTSSAEGSRHIKRRLLALCSDLLKCRKFQYIQDLATIDALRDIDYPSCAYLVCILRIYLLRIRVPQL